MVSTDNDIFNVAFTKGQEISEGNFGVFTSPKKPTKIFLNFWPSNYVKSGQIQKIKALY